jgi:hypothetical protein
MNWIVLGLAVVSAFAAVAAMPAEAGPSVECTGASVFASVDTSGNPPTVTVVPPTCTVTP